MDEKKETNPGVLFSNRNTDSSGPLWTVRELADYLQVTEQTIRSLARRGDLPAVKVGRVWRFRKDEIDVAIGK